MRHGRRIMQVRFPVNPADPKGESNGQLDSKSVSGRAGSMLTNCILTPAL